jgi:molybdate transport system substrate-binding protein
MLLSTSLLLVAAAADLASLEAPLSQAVRDRLGFVLQFSFGSSGLLARQIANGAPFDVYLSADERFVRQLADEGKIAPASVKVYAIGRLALWSKHGYRTLDDLRRPEVRHVAIANPDHAPYGVAAREALRNAGLWPAVERKIVFGENVRQALQFAETGNADAALVAYSLVVKRGVLVPASLHQPIRQAAGVVAASRQGALARRFLDFLLSPAGKAVLAQAGFE